MVKQDVKVREAAARMIAGKHFMDRRYALVRENRNDLVCHFLFEWGDALDERIAQVFSIF